MSQSKLSYLQKYLSEGDSINGGEIKREKKEKSKKRKKRKGSFGSFKIIDGNRLTNRDDEEDECVEKTKDLFRRKKEKIALKNREELKDEDDELRYQTLEDRPQIAGKKLGNQTIGDRKKGKKEP